MRRAALPAFVFAIVAPCAALADGERVHRCIGEHGEISFSGAPCAGASAAAATSHETQGPASIAGGAAKQTCPASEGALRDVIAEAFARRDANTLAGVMRWEGIGGAAARERMRELADLTGRPLVGIDVGGATLEARVDDAPPDAAETLMTVRTGGLDGGPSEREFRVTTAGGCYWLDW
jgi:hypothetical protein